MNDEALLQEFVAESREHLSSIEPDLLVLEREGQNTDGEIINRIFRAIHSIKGASGFFGLEALKRLSHSMENTFMLLRDGKLIPSGEVMDPLLNGVDRLRLMLEDIQASESVPYQDLVDQLETLMGNGPTEKPAASNTTQVETVDAVEPASNAPKELPYLIVREEVERAIRHGQHLYRIELRLDRDFLQQGRDPKEFEALLDSTGDTLASSVALSENAGLATCLEKNLSWHILYASVLEADLVQATFELADEQLEEITLESLFPEGMDSEKPAAETVSDDADQVAEPPIEQAVVSVADEVAMVPQQADAAELKAPAKSGTSGHESNETIRVKVDLLNRLMDLAGELVLARNQLNRMCESQPNASNEMQTIIQNVDLVTSDLQEHIMQTRMQAISSVFGKFPRLIRDLSRQLNKEINLEMSGEEVELDKSILESLSDPLTHLIRNCCDHAIELPDVREANGKTRQATVLLKAYQESGHINIAVIDDGAGIDHDKIAQKALEKGLISEATLRQMSVQEQVNLIFMPGFSTAEAVTDVSGRGVGMDVVRTNIEQIGGTITIDTEKGKGTTVQLRLPLTLAIIPSLIVRAAEQTFAVPQINLVELVCVKASQIAERIEKVGSASVLRLRGKLLPLIKLSHVLGLQDEYTDEQTGDMLPDQRKSLHDERLEGLNDTMKFVTPTERRREGRSDYNILVLKAGNRQYGLIVDEICDIEEIVVKPLSSFIKSCKCFSGATIMGDGTVSMILDVSGIITIGNLSFSEAQGEEEKRKLAGARDSRISSDLSQSVLLFNNAPNEIFALPVDSILRLEKIQAASIETVGHQRFLPYQGKSMSLIFLHEQLPVTPVNAETDEYYLIIPAGSQSQVGIIVSAILDAIDYTGQLESTAMSGQCVSGAGVVNQHIALFLNMDGLLQSAGFLRQEERGAEWQADRLQPSS